MCERFAYVLLYKFCGMDVCECEDSFVFGMVFNVETAVYVLGASIGFLLGVGGPGVFLETLGRVERGWGE